MMTDMQNTSLTAALSSKKMDKKVGRQPPSEIVEITPTIAAAWLDKNTINRKLKTSTLVKKYAADMKSGSWRLTFDPIRFGDDGSLLDGQHRLHACILADTPFASLVVYNMPSELRSVIDIGASRTTADVLTLTGSANASLLGGAARWLIAARSGVNTNTGVAVAVSVAQVLEAVGSHPKLETSVTRCMGAKAVPSPTLLMFLHYATGFVIGDLERADAFVNVFKTGVPDYAGCPAHKLREFIVHTRGQKSMLNRKEKWPATVHALNLFRKKTQIKLLRWGRDVELEGLDMKKL